MQSLSYPVITTWSSVHYGSVNKLELWTIAGKVGIVTGKQVDVRRFDMLIAMCAGGVGQPETAARPATASNAHRKCAQEAVRAVVDKRGCGTCPLTA